MTHIPIALVQVATAVCPLCAEHRPLPPGITSPAFDAPDPSLPKDERRRRQAIIAAWSDPIQQILAAECQNLAIGRHAEIPFYPESP